MTRYQTSGTCSKFIDLETDGRKVLSVRIYGGCRGQGLALAALVRHRPIRDVVRRLKWIRCGDRPTSCADQLARALEQELETAGQTAKTKTGAERVGRNERKR